MVWRSRSFDDASVVLKIPLIFERNFLSLFVRKEPFFPIQATAVSDEFSWFSDHSMTGNDDDDRILMIRSSDRSDGFRISDHGGLFEIVSCFSERNLWECIPGVFLELGSDWLQWNLEILSFSFEVFVKFLFCLDQDRIFLLYYFFFRRRNNLSDFFLEFFRILEFQKIEKICICKSSKISNRRWNRTWEKWHTIDYRENCLLFHIKIPIRGFLCYWSIWRSVFIFLVDPLRLSVLFWAWSV